MGVPRFSLQNYKDRPHFFKAWRTAFLLNVRKIFYVITQLGKRVRIYFIYVANLYMLLASAWFRISSDVHALLGNSPSRPYLHAPVPSNGRPLRSLTLQQHSFQYINHWLKCFRGFFFHSSNQVRKNSINWLM